MAGRELTALGAAMAGRRAAFVRAEAEGRKTRVNRRAQGGARSVYAGAAFNRLNSDWVMGPLSADQAISGDLQTLRDRGRELWREAPLARAFVRLSSRSIIGPKGMRLIPQVKTAAGALDDGVNKAVTAAWTRWCKRRNASANGQMAFRQIERQMVEVWKAEGEYLVHIVTGARNPFGFALQPLDNDQLDHTLNRAPGVGVNEIRMGVEIDEFGMPVAYHLWTAHPSEYAKRRTRVRVPAERIIHVYTAERVGQTRGVTALAPAIQRIRMGDGTDEALLVLLRTAACKMGFLEVSDEATALGLDESGQPVDRVRLDAEPGLVQQLDKGQTFKPWDPGQPTSEYGPFTKRIDRTTASAVGVSYGSLTGDLSEGNYGSMRVGMLGERDGWQAEQDELIEAFYERVYAAWMPWAIMSGQLPLAFDQRLLAEGAFRFQPRGFDWIDPLKDIEAAAKEVAMGINSLTRLAAERGRDIEEVLRERQAEIALAKKYGVTLGQDQYIESFGEAPKPGDATTDTTDQGAADGEPRRSRLRAAG